MDAMSSASLHMVCEIVDEEYEFGQELLDLIGQFGDLLRGLVADVPEP